MNSQGNEQNQQHCTDEQLLQPHSEQTIAHLAQCNDCQGRLWQQRMELSQLKRAAEQLPEYKPSPMAWDKIHSAIEQLPSQSESQQPTVLKPKKRAWFLPTTLAASFVVGSLITFMSVQFWQTMQVDEQIAMSRQYEHQLVAMQLTSPWVESQLWQISQIDKQLNEAHSVTAQKKLWQQRNEILQQLLSQPKNMNEMI